MPISKEHKDRFVYHFTHLDNLPGLIEHGLLSPNEQKRLNLGHKSIAIQEIQNRRASMKVTCGPGGVVHDYVPFYFCTRSSMLLSVVNAKNVDQMFLIHLAVPISVLERADVVFTKASANTNEAPDFFEDPSRLSNLNWGAIDSLKWSLSSDEEKQARMAEVLVHRRLDVSMLDHIVVWNSDVKKHVEELFRKAGLTPPDIRFDSHRYFTTYWNREQHSIVTGPYWTKRAYDASVSTVLATGQRESARFKNIAALLKALRTDMACLPETAELIGLESENDVHTEDVGAHTLSVVRNLISSPEFGGLSQADQRLVELAAYLHDIGKGPKSRWADKGGKQQVDPDHPIKSAEMLRRILTGEVTEIKPRSVRVLMKLVCYHDLIGDILGKGRNPEQLEEIAGTERELDMLIALGLADMRSVNPYWNMQHAIKVPNLRARVLAVLSAPEVEQEE